MKITGVRLRPYQITLQRPIGDVNNPTGSNKVTSTAVFIASDEALSDSACYALTIVAVGLIPVIFLSRSVLGFGYGSASMRIADEK